ncbi:class I SAM-dependent methyltransferase [Parasphingorhabdus halotolerans]|uniref:Methyltransferase domain-containing protein n=1 Tax=Parasphingorhabdus halotolerans TaxID=2725558 RepID=A0A6H2DP80_9SPHN|nr:class I SAM-dependent methyltransferase [Parasphingorhabdus halotolerans]QJB70469.1 methyltransferase domain-containing protein [Parasphingorhabdus halotolerans]
MTNTTPDNPENVQTEDWAGEMGQKWLKNLPRFEGMIEPIGDALLARANYREGESVLDIGFGGGATTIAIAEAVAPTGKVMGVDISPDLADAARDRATKAGITNAQFTCADAATVQLKDAPYDRLCSRFGSMFFEDPVAAFTNLHGLLRSGSRIDLAIWGPPRDNLWMMEMMSVVKSHVEVPPAIPRAPGPFAFEDLEYLNEILATAGFSDVSVDTYKGLQPIGGPEATPQEAVDFVLGSMAAGRLLKEEGDDVFRNASDDLVALFEKHHVTDKGVMMKAKAWLVSGIAE